MLSDSWSLAACPSCCTCRAAERKGAAPAHRRKMEPDEFERLAKRNKEMSMSGVGLANKNTFDKKRAISELRWEDDEVPEGTEPASAKWVPPHTGKFQVLVRVSQEVSRFSLSSSSLSSPSSISPLTPVLSCIFRAKIHRRKKPRARPSSH